MIFDSISNWGEYFKGNKTWEKAFKFIQSLPAGGDVKDGRNEIDGDDIYANVSSYEPLSEADGIFESHRKYIDIQLLLSGCEKLYSCATEELTAKTEYNSEKDFLLFDSPDTPTVEIPIKPGCFAMFYPHDAHKPCIRCCGACAKVKKVVVKIKASLLA
ncbi:MAG: hypothetical protein A2020_09655 [Lentisphaerae bacterium GWF2_45_14]|nr:MAG: hypothetical protein A2020_09655 [Lentisphaerae bacterium GWF2_45_14]